MVGIVLVSHSRALAGGAAALAREMGGEAVGVAAAGGIEADPEALGTDAERVRAAIDEVGSPDGVLVLMDLGSALMSAEFAAELVPGVRVVLSDAPLVEGAVAAAAAAGAGATLDEVAAEARGALEAKRVQLGGDAGARGEGGGAAREGVGPAGAGAPARESADVEAQPAASAELPVLGAVGLHARPAARVVTLTRGFDVDVRLTLRERTVDAASLTGVVSLGARRGDTVQASASGPDAARALDALRELAEAHFGDRDDVGGQAAAPEDAPPSMATTSGVGLPPPRADDTPTPEPGSTLTGIPVGGGIALGPARALGGAPAGSASGAGSGGGAPAGDGLRSAPETPEDPATSPDEARAALDAALDRARAEITEDRDRVARRAGDGTAAIFDVHLALLDDAALLDRAREAIRAGAGAARGWRAAVADVAAIYRGLEDPVLRERAADVLDVGRRVLADLAGEPARGPAPEGIVVADELTPAAAAALDPGRITGVATAGGSATAHAAILARGLGLPAVVGLGPALLAIPPGTELLLDGRAGTVIVAPDEATTRAARERDADDALRRRTARAHAHEAAVTRDGTRVQVLANVGRPSEVAEAVALGADGVGLFRTEFLYLDRPELPDEEEQVATLREAAVTLEGRPLVVRTLDAGADKPLPALSPVPEVNPFLGVRGVRLSLAHPGVLLAQLRALVRTAAEFPGQLRAMLPMIAVVEEIVAVRELLDRARAELAVGAPLPFGIMVETPAAALEAGALAAHVDFFSIGTNDLTQYVMAAERGNPRVAGLLHGLRDPVRELVARTVASGRPVAVCGELAGDPEAAPALVRAGVRELSVAPPLIPEIKAVIRELAL